MKKSYSVATNNLLGAMRDRASINNVAIGTQKIIYHLRLDFFFSQPLNLHVEMAAVVDWGKPFVKGCYYLKGDGPLSLCVL